LLQDYRTVKLR